MNKKIYLGVLLSLMISNAIAEEKLADVSKNKLTSEASAKSSDVKVESKVKKEVSSISVAEDCMRDTICKAIIESKLNVNNTPVAAQTTNLPPPVGMPAPMSLKETFVNTMGGMTPDQVRQVREMLDQHTKAITELPGTPPKPVTTSVSVSMSPGSTPPVIRLFPGYATSLTVTDSTGAVWPVENWAIGNKSIFDVKRLDDVATFSIVPTGNYAQSNMIINLKGNPTPVSITFITGQKEVDYRVDLRVQAIGPNAQIAVAGLPANVNNQLLSVLDGVVPKGSKILRAEKDNLLSVWMSPNGKYFVRSKYAVLSPAFLGSVKSSDGTNVYEMMPTNVLLMMVDGKITQSKIFE